MWEKSDKEKRSRGWAIKSDRTNARSTRANSTAANSHSFPERLSPQETMQQQGKNRKKKKKDQGEVVNVEKEGDGSRQMADLRYGGFEG
jgi:hypothetical protein